MPARTIISSSLFRSTNCLRAFAWRFVALQRTGYAASEDVNVFTTTAGCISIIAAACVTVDGDEVHLTPMEYKLLCVLARNTGKVLTHNYILKEVWGSALASDMASLRVFMATLRKKIEFDPSHPRNISRPMSALDIA